MTTELEKQFFDTCGIEPIEEKYCYWECKKPELENVACNNTEWKHCDICEKLIKTKDGANGKKRGHLLTEEDLRCDFYPNCYYKQLKRKEQECKALREEKAYTDMACEQLQNQLKAKEQEYERLKRDYFKQNEWLQEQKKELDQLKAENEKLRFPMQDTNYAILTKEEFKKYKKLKQTLTEIKEIADTCHNTSNCKECKFWEKCQDGGFLLILQKCEVLDE